MTVTLEAEISPGMSAEGFVELAVHCEQAGFDRFGVSDVVFWPDCFVLQGLIAQATSRIHIGSMVTNPYSRHPAMLAGAAATLQELSGGRMFLGVGVGAGLEDLRIDYPRPVRALREAIVGIRGLLAGETVQLDGEMFPIDGARLVRPPEVPVPISVGTRSPQVMRLAGELADIALVGARHFTAEIAQQYFGWLAEGAAPDRPGHRRNGHRAPPDAVRVVRRRPRPPLGSAIRGPLPGHNPPGGDRSRSALGHRRSPGPSDGLVLRP